MQGNSSPLRHHGEVVATKWKALDELRPTWSVGDALFEQAEECVEISTSRAVIARFARRELHRCEGSTQEDVGSAETVGVALAHRKGLGVDEGLLFALVRRRVRQRCPRVAS